MFYVVLVFSTSLEVCASSIDLSWEKLACLYDLWYFYRTNRANIFGQLFIEKSDWRYVGRKFGRQLTYHSDLDFQFAPLSVCGRPEYNVNEVSASLLYFHRNWSFESGTVASKSFIYEFVHEYR